MAHFNFLVRFCIILCLMVCKIQSVPILNPFRKEILASMYAMYRPEFPGPYTLYPKPPALQSPRGLRDLPVAPIQTTSLASETSGAIATERWFPFKGYTTLYNTSWTTTPCSPTTTAPVETLTVVRTPPVAIISNTPNTSAAVPSSTAAQSTFVVVASGGSASNIPSTSTILNPSTIPQSTFVVVSTSPSTTPAASASVTRFENTTTPSTQPTSGSVVATSPPLSGSQSALPLSSTPAIVASTSAQASQSSSAVASVRPFNAPLSGPRLNVAFQKNLAGSNVHVYVTGLDVNGAVVMLTTEGTFYYPSTSSQTPQPINANVAIPVSQPLTIPGYISSARLWFAVGKLNFSVVATANGPGIVAPTSVNPADASHNVNWGFVELTYNDSGLFANLSYVDFVGLPLGIKLTTSQGGVQNAPGLPTNAVVQVCDKLRARAAVDGRPWGKLCVFGSNGNLIRVNSPGSLLASDPGAFSGYFANYVNNVWNHYRSSPLMINTQNGLGTVACQVGSDNLLTCAGDNRPYAKPTAADIFSCSTGPFSILSGDNSVHLAVVPRLCAAFNRATLLLSRGNIQPGPRPRTYYKQHPNNEYSAVVHDVEISGKGYAFPYDDVSPSIYHGVSGSVFATDPKVLTVTIGG